MEDHTIQKQIQNTLQKEDNDFNALLKDYWMTRVLWPKRANLTASFMNEWW